MVTEKVVDLAENQVHWLDQVQVANRAPWNASRQTDPGEAWKCLMELQWENSTIKEI